MLLLPTVTLAGLPSSLAGRVVAFAGSRSLVPDVALAPGWPAAPVPVHCVWNAGRPTRPSQCAWEDGGFGTWPPWFPHFVAVSSFAECHRITVRVRGNQGPIHDLTPLCCSHSLDHMATITNHLQLSAAYHTQVYAYICAERGTSPEYNIYIKPCV